MRKFLMGAAVLAALLMSGCGTSAEDKAKIEAQEKKISKLEKQLGDVEKSLSEVKAKAETPATPAPKTPAPEKQPGKTPPPQTKTK
jgi:outer membrane murein-binding lipoprotein Lpp